MLRLTQQVYMLVDATEVLLFLSAATSFNGFDKCPDKDGKDENKIAAGYLDKAVKKSFTELFKNHISDYHKYFNRVSLSLNNADKTKKIIYRQTRDCLLIQKVVTTPG